MPSIDEPSRVRPTEVLGAIRDVEDKMKELKNVKLPVLELLKETLNELKELRSPDPEKINRLKEQFKKIANQGGPLSILEAPLQRLLSIYK